GALDPGCRRPGGRGGGGAADPLGAGADVPGAALLRPERGVGPPGGAAPDDATGAGGAVLAGHGALGGAAPDSQQGGCPEARPAVLTGRGLAGVSGGQP